MSQMPIPQRKRQTHERSDSLTVNPNQILPSVELVVGNSFTDVIGLDGGSLYQYFRSVLSYETDAHLWSSRGQNWDGRVSVVCRGGKYCRCRHKSPHVHFPTGLLYMAKEFFAVASKQCIITDARELPPKNKNIEFSDGLVLRDYQQETIDAAVAKGRGIIKAATGAGKTVMCAGIIKQLQRSPVLFLVTSRDLMEQAAGEFERFLREDGKPIVVGRVCGGTCNLADITVMTVQTAVRCLGDKYEKFDEEDGYESASSIDEDDKSKILNFIKNSTVMFCDEVQHWAAKTCQSVSSACVNARFRFGVSATPWRDLNDDMLIDSCFGRAFADIKASDLIQRGVLVQPKIYFIKTSSRQGGTYPQVYKECVVNNELRNKAIADYAVRLREEGRKVLVLIRQIDHGRILNDMIPDSVFINGLDSTNVRNKCFNDMRSGISSTVCIATSIFDEGIDVRPLDALILGGSGKSSTRALQRIGRVIRCFDGKKDAIVVDFDDDVKYLRKHSKARKKIYETEPLYQIKRIVPSIPIVK